jgi:hypothetical protein
MKRNSRSPPPRDEPTKQETWASNQYAAEDDWDPEYAEQFADAPKRITSAEVLELLRGIEHHRQQIADQSARFERWLAGSSELQAVWTKFTRAGGFTADEFGKFIEGRMRHRICRQRRHLRLLVNPRRPLMIRRSGGTDAA